MLNEKIKVTQKAEKERANKLITLDMMNQKNNQKSQEKLKEKNDSLQAVESQIKQFQKMDESRKQFISKISALNNQIEKGKHQATHTNQQNNRDSQLKKYHDLDMEKYQKMNARILDHRKYQSQLNAKMTQSDQKKQAIT